MASARLAAEIQSRSFGVWRYQPDVYKQYLYPFFVRQEGGDGAWVCMCV